MENAWKGRMHLVLSVCLLFFVSSLEAFAEIKTSFAFTHEPIDVVIPSVEKDLSTLQLCIEGIRANGINVRRIIVVSKNKFTDLAEWYDEQLYPFSYSDVAQALAKDDPEMLDSLLQKGSRTGWYYQQLLKLYAPRVIPGISSNVLVLDSDTIFLNPVSFLNEEGAGLYNPGIEHNPPYFEHAGELIPGFYKLFPADSGISHHMIFQRPVIDELFELVESVHAAPFWHVFCHLVKPENIIYSGASEYEIYFNYVFSRTDQTAVRRLNWKNIERLCEIPMYQEQGLDYVSAHMFSRIE